MSVVHVDSRHAWKTVAGCFIANFILGGLGKSYGIIMQDFKEVFNSGSAILLMAGGLIYTLMYILSSIIYPISKRYGYRPVVFVGAIGSCLSLLAAAYSPNVVVWVFVVGLVLGSSFSCINFTTYSVVGRCFRRHLGIAHGVSVAGVCVGQMTFPSLLTYLSNVYGIRNATVVVGAICLHLVVTAVLMPRHIIGPNGENQGKFATRGSLSTDEVKKAKSGRRLWKLVTCQTVDGKGIKRKRSGTKLATMSNLKNSPETESTIVDLSCMPGQTDDSAEFHCEKSQPKLLVRALLVVYVLAKVLADTGDITVSFVAPGHGTDLGISSEFVSRAITFCGLADLVTRLLFGWLIDKPRFNGYRGIVMAVTWLIDGANALVFSLISRPTSSSSEPSIAVVVVFCVCYGIHGMTTGSATTLMVAVLGEWVGPANLSQSLAITMVVLGLFISPGQFMIGLLADRTGDFVWSFRCCSLLLASGGTCLLLEFPVRYYFKSSFTTSTYVNPATVSTPNRSKNPSITFTCESNYNGCG